MLRDPIQNRRVDILALKFRVLTRVFYFSNFVRYMDWQSCTKQLAKLVGMSDRLVS
jgi:hypothetical protein